MATLSTALFYDVGSTHRQPKRQTRPLRQPLGGPSLEIMFTLIQPRLASKL